MPAETLRATYTDWAAVRGLADGTDLGAASSTRDVGSFLERAYDQDLVSASAVADSTYAMNEQYGFSPVDAAWEMYGQSREGAVVVMAMTDEVDLEGVERNLRSLGYQAPAEGAGTGGTWAGSADLVATIDPRSRRCCRTWWCCPTSTWCSSPTTPPTSRPRRPW